MPFCRDTRRAASSPRLSSAPANRSSASARSSADQEDHPLGSSKAARAARTAASISAFVPSGTEPIGSSVLAESTDMRSSPSGSVQSPPMKSSLLSIVVCVLMAVSPLVIEGCARNPNPLLCRLTRFRSCVLRADSFRRAVQARSPSA